MIKFRDLSIKKKLVIISMVTSGIALVFASLAFIIGEYYASRKALYENTCSLARIIGANCVAPLTFNDKDAAREDLSALAAEPQITIGRIYNADGHVFAQYIQADINPKVFENTYSPLKDNINIKDLLTTSAEEKKYLFHTGILDVVEPIIQEGKVIGIVEIRSDLKGLYQRLNTAVVICFFILGFCFFIAYLVSNKVQHTISNPISMLTHTMNKVSQVKDYTIRVKRDSKDEMGTLFDVFNEMLENIQTRDERLHFIQFSVDRMGDSAIWTDMAGNIVDVNNTACISLGYTRDELLSMTVFDIDTSDFKDFWEEMISVVRREKTLSLETKHKTKNGNVFPVEVSINYLEYKGKEYLCTIDKDITDRKQLQSQLDQAKKMEAIGTLASGVAHDLNNILGGLVSYPDLLLMDLPPNSPLRKSIQSIKQSGDKAAAIVQDMLTLARRGVNLQVAVNLNDIVNEYTKSREYETICQFNSAVRFEMQLDESLPNILGSPFHLSKSLMNLVSNAVEAMPEGGVVTIRTTTKRTRRAIEGHSIIPRGEYVVLSVADEGTGITDENKDKIFEPFYTKKMMGRSGTGLGMTVVAGTVEDHNGFINLHTEKNQGTCFDLYFPITREIILEDKDQFALDVYRGTENLLVIDDVVEQREIASMVLGKLGYKVDVVSSGEAALEYLSRNQVDLLILDMIMEPGLDGFETYKRILKMHPGQKAIITSGHAETDRVKETLKLGASTFIKKPYSVEDLVVAVRNGLDQKQHDDT